MRWGVDDVAGARACLTATEGMICPPRDRRAIPTTAPPRSDMYARGRRELMTDDILRATEPQTRLRFPLRPLTLPARGGYECLGRVGATHYLLHRASSPPNTAGRACLRLLTGSVYGSDEGTAQSPDSRPTSTWEHWPRDVSVC